MNTLSGIFMGAKMFIGKSTLKVTGLPLNKEANESDMQVAPAAHVGYRVVGIGGATLAFYIGGGANLNKVELETDSAIGATGSDFEYVQERLNKNTSGFRLDYGLTIGIAF